MRWGPRPRLGWSRARRPCFRLTVSVLPATIAVVLSVFLSGCGPPNLVLVDDLTAALGELYDDDPFFDRGLRFSREYEARIVPPAELADRIQQEAEAGRERIIVGPLYADLLRDDTLPPEELGVELGILVVGEVGAAAAADLPSSTRILRFDRTDEFRAAGVLAAERAGDGVVRLFAYPDATGAESTIRYKELDAFRAGVADAGGRLEDTVYSQMPSREELRGDLDDGPEAEHAGAYGIFLGHGTWQAIEVLWDSEVPVVAEWVGRPDGPVVATVEPDFKELFMRFFSNGRPGPELFGPGRLVKRE